LTSGDTEASPVRLHGAGGRALVPSDAPLTERPSAPGQVA
jgi:hypothetical protein